MPKTDPLIETAIRFARESYNRRLEKQSEAAARAWLLRDFPQSRIVRFLTPVELAQVQAQLSAL